MTDFIELFNRIDKLQQDYLIKLVQNTNFIYDNSMERSNIRKNRYSNILPLEHTSVKLVNSNILSDTNYINANYIDFTSNMCKYIAGQAPLPHTFEAFWLMVLEHKSPVILMLTGLVENNVRKADQYWPSQLNETLDLGKIKLILLSENIIADCNCIERVIKIMFCGIEHTVTQIQYHDWGDMSVASNISDIFKIMFRVEELTYLSKSNSRSVVHCSAGVGRTGTFIAIHALTYILRNGNSLDNNVIINIIIEMRKCRLNMVQNEIQLKYVYDCISYFQQHNYILYGNPTPIQDIKIKD